jgi:hypothetical protein
MVLGHLFQRTKKTYLASGSFALFLDVPMDVYPIPATFLETITAALGRAHLDILRSVIILVLDCPEVHR